MSADVATVLAGVARSAVDAQAALDADARDRLEAWAEDGIPPSALAFTQLHLGCSARLAARPRASHDRSSRLALDPGGVAHVGVTLRLFPRDLETLDEDL